MVTPCHLQDSFFVLVSKGFACRKGSGSFPFWSLRNKQPTYQQNHRRWKKHEKNCQQKDNITRFLGLAMEKIQPTYPTRNHSICCQINVTFVQRLVAEGWLPSWCCRPLFSNWAGTMWRRHGGWVVDDRFLGRNSWRFVRDQLKKSIWGESNNPHVW